MTKVSRSISIDAKILRAGEEQAKKERRSLSSLIEFLLDKHLNKKNVQFTISGDKLVSALKHYKDSENEQT